ncbi:hypothetical protein [Methylobacterium sp. J-077]|uniref:hypothetical protein n=1 Tax=Methylobacterium sp. J-077 TaxID=2836656 RepID=UPI001FB956BD|nr:hypothetical protein [Methylobacterium sp. J-077]MCJ2122379.1 hypothetical protein [Methylobacterium sp. J-077]
MLHFARKKTGGIQPSASFAWTLCGAQRWPKAVRPLPGMRWIKTDVSVRSVLPKLEMLTRFPDRMKAIPELAKRRMGSVGKAIEFPTRAVVLPTVAFH